MNYAITLPEYIETERKLWEAEIDLVNIPFDPISLNICGEYYQNICTHCRQGGTITQGVYNSLDSLNQYHFNKHYNSRGTAIIN